MKNQAKIRQLIINSLLALSLAIGVLMPPAVTALELDDPQVAGHEAEKIFFMQDKAAAYHRLIELLVTGNRNEEALLVAEKLKSRVLRERLASWSSRILDDNLSKISLNLPTDSLVASYVLTSRHCFVFLVRANKPLKIITLPVGAAGLRTQIGRYRRSILTFDPSFKMKARELYNLLLKPAEIEFSETKRLILIPDGALWEQPFQALIGSSGTYLIEERELSYTPSLSVLSTLNSSAPAPLKAMSVKKLVAFANAARKDTAPLPEAEREAAGIGRLYDTATKAGRSSKIFIKTNASESRFKQTAANADILHLAVHGEINQTNPFATALLLTEDQDNDGRLTMTEILQLKLLPGLVVLSACDTSHGEILSGEGLLSLSWAFLAAGSRSVVAAQWAVEEKATADLMLAFHRHLIKNRSHPAAALRASQNESLKRPVPFNHPFYWAGFVTVEGPQR